MTGLRRQSALGAAAVAMVFGIVAAPASAERLVAATDGPVPALIVVDSAMPSMAVTGGGPMPLLGLGAGESLVGIDYRPSNGELYAVTKDGVDIGRLYTIRIDPAGIFAQASQVDGLAFGLGAASGYGIDWDPVTDRLRIVSNLAVNLRIDPDNLILPVEVHGSLAYDAGDPNVGTNPPEVTAIAYSNNTSGASATTLYAFDTSEILSRLGSPGGAPISPASGQLFTIRTTASTTNGDQGLDIAPDGTAFMSATNAVNAFLIEVDLTSPAGPLGTTLGQIGTDANIYRHISVIPAGIISIDDAVVREAAGGFLVTLHRRGGSVGQVSVNFATANGTATAGQDYTAVNGTFTFDEGQEEETVFVPVAQDSAVEGDETILLQLANATNGASAGGGAVLTIDDDDSKLSVSDVTVREDVGNAVVTVTRTDSATGTVSVNAATAPGSATASDFTPSNAALTFNPGVRQRTLVVPITDDTAVEGTESFTVELSGVSGQGEIDDASATVSILDAGDLPPVPDVAITAPADRKVRPDGPIRVAADASGGTGGVASVTFALDGRVLCVDTSPPFECDVRLIGADVGAKTLTATAVDQPGGTRTAATSIFVRRFKPDSVDVTATRRGGPGLPATILVRGQIPLPEGVEAVPGCDNGSVRIVFQARGREVEGRDVELGANCGFRLTQRFADSDLPRGTEVVRVEVHFTGSLHLRPRNAQAVRVRIQ